MAGRHIGKHRRTNMSFKKLTSRIEKDKKKRHFVDNKGKMCSSPNCNHKARVKGLCISCYQIQRNAKRKEVIRH